MRRSFHALVLAALLGVATLGYAAADIETLGFDRGQVESSLLGALRGWYGGVAVPDAVRAMNDAEKVATVHTLAAFARAYFASSEFTHSYDEARKASKPKRSFGLPKLDLDAKAIARKALDKASGKPAPVGELDKDPRAQLAKRLEAFLAATEDVDYDAETTLGGRKGRFVNDDYEMKPNEWKMCYRAGKPAAQAIRKAAEDWLAELR